jgi:hypothetical protein
LEDRLDVFDDLDVFGELCDPGVINPAASPEACEGIDTLKCYRFSRAAMSDQRSTDSVLVADDEYVVVRAVRESTWSAGSFRGFAEPQGVTTAVEIVDICRLAAQVSTSHSVRDPGLTPRTGARMNCPVYPKRW